MTTIRLNSRIRSEICDNAIIKSDVRPRRQTLKTKKAEWAEKVRIKAIGGAESDNKINNAIKRIDKILSDLPDGVKTGYHAIRQNCEIYLNIAGHRYTAQFSGNDSRKPRDEQIIKVTPYEFVLKADDPLTEEFHQLENEYEVINARESDIRANVNAVLGKVNTVGRLLELWPEAKELLPTNLSPPKPQLPAVKIDDLNVTIGLPTGDDKQ